MKAIVDAQLFVKELKKLSPVIKQSTIIPILTCVKLVFEKEKVTITATDLETTVLLTTNCECKKPFSFIVQYSDIVDMCSKLNEPITIELSGDNIVITGDNSKLKIARIIDEKSFPNVDEEEFEATFDADADFFEALLHANSCRSTDDFKTNMNEACIHLKGKELTVVGIDAYVAYKRDFKIKTGIEAKAMVKEQFVQMVKGFLSAKISVGTKFVKAEAEDITVITRRSESVFCNYESILPEEIKFNFCANRPTLVKSLSIASSSAAKSTGLCAINFKESTAVITSQDISYNKESETKLLVQQSVEIEAIGVSAPQLLKLLNFFDSNEIDMGFRGANHTIFLRPSGEPNVLCLIQPLSLQ